MPNVKPGDLCIILGTCETPGLSGRVVEVVQKAYTGDCFRDENSIEVVWVGFSNDCWEVKSMESLPFLMSSGEIKWMKSRPVHDRVLFKIKDKDVDMETETVKELEKV